jgi:hypothetical protein
MTSIFFDPATFVAPDEPEPRDQLIVNGRYMLPPLGDPTGKRRSLQRVTNLVKQLSEQDGLVKWKLRMAVIGLARDERLYDLATSLTPENKRDLDDLIEKAIDLGQAGPSGGNITGTALHNYTDDKPGEYPIRVRDKWVPKVENYYRALHDKGLRVVPGLSERLVVSERLGTAGRLDDVYEDPFGVLRVGDRKSQKTFYTWWEIGAQLACYQGSDAMWNEDECRWEDMPKLADDYVHVAWMPLSHPTQRDGVTIYDLPLDAAREVLEECVRVRELRRGAKSWGRERMDIGDFARCARDIRDAETQDDLRKIHAERSAVLNQDLIEMAAKRWEELAEVEAPEPASVDLENLGQYVAQQVEAVRAMTPDDVSRLLGTTNISLNGDIAPPVDFECRYDGKRVSEHPINVPGQFHCMNPVPRPVADSTTVTINGTHEAVTNFVAPVIRALDSTGVERPREERLTLLQSVVMFDPALFVAPQDDATFPMPGDVPDRPRTGGGEVPGAGEPAGTVTKPREAGATIEERKQLQAEQWRDGEGMLRTPDEWAKHLSLGDTLPSVGTMTLAEFRARYDRGNFGIVPDQEAVEEARMQEIEERMSSPIVPKPSLDSVPLKIVKEIATRAGNSSTARGRVRLLNDIESNKPGYVKHAGVLIPAVLAEWLAVDGGPEETAAGTVFVRNTEGSKRKAMHADLAGPTTLTAYLARKEGPTPDAPAEAQRAQEATSGVESEASRVVTPKADPEAPVHEYGATQTVRQKYVNVTGGEHSILRLIEMAKQAENGAERAKVFHEITRRKAWTGAIAAEINQHYLDNGYATEDFDPYFEEQERTASALPLDPDDPATAQDALHLLEGVTDRAALALMWQQLATKPFFADQALQEALLGKMATLPT